MSLLPLVLNDVLGDRRALPTSLFDQHFGLGVLGEDLVQPHYTLAPLLSAYYRPWRQLATRNSGVSSIHSSKDGFKVNLDVQQFKPEEVTVKMVGNSVVVEGKHEERQDEHGFISRQFQRRYVLPDDINLDAIKSQLSSDGVLTIEAPKKALTKESVEERVIQISQTNAPAVSQASPAAGGESGDATSEKREQ